MKRQAVPILLIATGIATLILQFFYTNYTRSINRPWPRINILNDNTNPWSNIPDFQIYLRLTSNYRFEHEYKDLFLRTMKLFLPKEVAKLVVVLDDDKLNDHQLGSRLSIEWPFPDICYSKAGNSSTYFGSGRVRMFWDMLNADECTIATYVGFVDTDTFFSTLVTPELLFEDGKPVIVAKAGALMFQCWEDTTEFIIGKKSVMQCMSTFPLMMKTSHIKEMRDVLSKKRGKPFHEIFRDADKHKRGECICQFSVMCNYVWYYHRDEYSWHVQMVPDGNWTGAGHVDSQATFEYMKEAIKPEMRLPIPRSSIHLRYTTTEDGKQLDHKEPEKIVEEDFIKEGLCYSAGFEYCPDKCKRWNSKNVHYNLYSFEYSQWIWDDRCKREQDKHYKNVKRLVDYYKYNYKEIFSVNSIHDVCKLL